MTVRAMSPSNLSIKSLRYKGEFLRPWGALLKQYFFPCSSEKNAVKGWASLLNGTWKKACDTSIVETYFLPLRWEKTSIWVTKLVGSRMVALFKSLPSSKIRIWDLSFFLVTKRLEQNRDGSSHSLIIPNSIIWSRINLTWSLTLCGKGTNFWILGFVSSIRMSISISFALPKSRSCSLKASLCLRNIVSA